MSRVLGLLLALLLGGCLTWTPPGAGDDDDATGDDDDATGDDDDSTGDDDDSTGDDDDATGDDDDDDASPPVPLAAHAVVAVIATGDLGGGAPNGGLATAIFADEPLSPSAEEAAYEDVIGFPILVFAEGGVRTAPADQYPGPYASAASAPIVQSAQQSVALEAQGDGWGTYNPVLLQSDEQWSTTVPAGVVGAGDHLGPRLPTLPVASSDRLFGRVLYLSPNWDTVLLIDSGEGDTVDSVGVLYTGSGGPADSRAFPIDGSGAVTFVGTADLTSGSQLFVQRHRRILVDVDGGSLLLTASSFAIGDIVVLSTQDVLLVALDDVDLADPAGTVVTFSVDPPILSTTVSYDVDIGGRVVPGSYSGGVLSVTLDPAELNTGTLQVSIGLPTGGAALGTLLVTATPPPCDLIESASNDTVVTADWAGAGQVICGAIEAAGDEDYIVFNATLGARYRFTMWGQRLGAPTDPYITALDATGAVLGENDDWYGLDSRLDVTAPATGPLYLKIRDYDATKGGLDVEWRLVTGAPPPGP